MILCWIEDCELRIGKLHNPVTDFGILGADYDVMILDLPWASRNNRLAVTFSCHDASMSGHRGSFPEKTPGRQPLFSGKTWPQKFQKKLARKIAADYMPSTTLRLENKQVWNRRMPLLVSEVVKLLAIQPETVRLIWLKLDFQHTRLLVCFVAGLSYYLRG